MFTLTCCQCRSQAYCRHEDALARLRLLGLLRREKEPTPELVEELLLETAPRMTCSVCRAIGLRASPADDEPWEADDWQAAALCEICHEPIPPARLEALPGATRCVRCQGELEEGTAVDDEPEFCPKCGAQLEIRVSRGAGITRYKKFCTGLPPCRL